jgi:ankyrin repeat protein
VFQSGGSHLIQKRRISAKELINDMRAGIADSGLSEKHRISPEGLQFMMRRLVDAGLITSLELSERSSLTESRTRRESVEKRDPGFRCHICRSTIPRELDECPYCDAITGDFENRLILDVPSAISGAEQAPLTVEDIQTEITGIFPMSEETLWLHDDSQGVDIPVPDQDIPNIPDVEHAQKPPVDRTKILLRAASRGQLETVRSLVQSGTNVDSRSKYGNTPLMRAAYKGHVRVAEFLLDNGADINAQNMHGNTPLLVTVSSGHSEMIEFLLRRGADPEIKNMDGNAPLTVAAVDGKVLLVQLLVQSAADANVRNNWSDTPLMKASDAGHLPVVRLLLEEGADPNAKNKFGNTALMKAAYKGYTQIAKKLLEAGADVNAKNVYGNTALMKASYGNHLEIVKLLLASGADAGAKDDDGNTAFSRASNIGSHEILGLLTHSLRKQ